MLLTPPADRVRQLPARVLVLGCGSVAQCTVPLLIRDLPIDACRR